MDDRSASRQIDDIIKLSDDWRGKLLAELRAIVQRADPAAVEEVKWKKPSKPEGVPVWSHNGIVCLAEALKNVVRLTFPNGARLKDTAHIFNARLDGTTVRTVDFHEGDIINEHALRMLILEAIALNTVKPHL